MPDWDLDEAVFLWLDSHRTWFDDIYPESFGRGAGKIVTDMLYDNSPNSSKQISNFFIAMAEDCPDHYDRQARWWSEALDMHLDEIVELGNFKDEIKHKIYLYLENDIEDFIFCRASTLKAETEREHGIYKTEVRGNC